MTQAAFLTPPVAAASPKVPPTCMVPTVTSATIPLFRLTKLLILVFPMKGLTLFSILAVTCDEPSDELS